MSKLNVPSVSVTYARNGSSSSAETGAASQ